MAKEFDDDIEAMNLGWGEKSGLQMYRNYTKAFDNFAEEGFAKRVNSENFDTARLAKVCAILASEDARFLPVVLCGFADEILLATFKTAVPAEIPGGVKDLFGQYGPISTLNQRTKIAYVAHLLSPDLLEAVDLVRRARNKLAHDWSIDEMKGFFKSEPISQLPAIDEMISEREGYKHLVDLEPIVAFRIRLIWLVGRLAYEGPLYHRAMAARLQPHGALYGKNQPARLREVARVAMEATWRVTGMAQPTR